MSELSARLREVIRKIDVKLEPKEACLWPEDFYYLQKLALLLPECVDAFNITTCAKWITIGVHCRPKDPDKCARCGMLARIERCLEEMG